MSNKKTETSNSSFDNKYEYAFTSIPDTPDLQAYRDMEIETDPTIPYRFAAARRQMANTYSNPLGSYATPEMQEQRYLADSNELMQQQGQANREGAFDKNRLEMAKASELLAYTRPIRETTRQYGTGQASSVQSSGGWGSFLGGLAGAGLQYIPKI